MIRVESTTLKFAAFTTVMIVVAGFLLLVFSDYRAGDTVRYGAVFTDASGLRSGDTVRIAGVRVGTVNSVDLEGVDRVHIDFDVDREIALPDGTGAAVRYLNLVGDRYLELTDGTGATPMSSGAEIPVTRTSPALDLDVLLGGLKPVIDGLQPQQVNTLSSAVLEVLQGQRANVRSLFANSASLFSTLGKNTDVVEELIDQLDKVMATLSADRDKFGEAIDRLDALIGDLSEQRDPIGAAITALDNGTASVADLLTQARPSLSGSIDELARLAPAVAGDQPTLEHAHCSVRRTTFGSWCGREPMATSSSTTSAR